MALDRPSVHYVRGEVIAKLSHARALAAQIEDLLVGLTPEEVASAGYQVRLAQGITRSLIDQLEEIERGPSSSRKIVLPESSRAQAP